ncbi:hypothetical protein [Arthrobacter sp. UM1]|uniref:hypothetical protein n=1 Tax=Arthrobacter sp. UM1 TaxID=2766776 RepID=UPI001CF6A67A|nr:hypothetical protein [Arthrobacter sp. UM1]MCB4209210.1 hypothetical protein [Arthrobacter sp. UM1]
MPPETQRTGRGNPAADAPEQAAGLRAEANPQKPGVPLPGVASEADVAAEFFEQELDLAALPVWVNPEAACTLEFWADRFCARYEDLSIFDCLAGDLGRCTPGFRGQLVALCEIRLSGVAKRGGGVAPSVVDRDGFERLPGREQWRVLGELDALGREVFEWRQARGLESVPGWTEWCSIRESLRR